MSRLLGIGRRREHRAAESYTDLLLAAQLSAVSSVRVTADATAAVRTSGEWWARVLSLAEVSPATPATAALTPDVLARIGRRLAVRGEYVAQIVMRGGRLALVEALTADVEGGDDPTDWLYRLTVSGPTTTTTRRLPADAVLHVMHDSSPARPWSGVPLWATAPLTAGTLAGVERQLRNEAQGKSGYLLDVSDTGDEPADADATPANPSGPVRGVAATLGTAKGETVALPGLAAGTGEPTKTTAATRFGVDPPQSTVMLRQQVEACVFALYGVNPSMVGLGTVASGQLLREGWRALVNITVAGLARSITPALAAALDTPDLALDLAPARASDIATIARAYGIFRRGEMPDADARAAAGVRL